MKTPLRFLALLLSLLLSVSALSACTSKDSSNIGDAPNDLSSRFHTASARTDDAPSENLKSFYSQNITWESCTDKFDGYCAKIDIPLDYDDPGRGKSSLSLGILPSRSGNPRGTIFINPGGPGGSGLEALRTDDGRYDQLLSNYHILGFDPRGVGSSDPIQCYDAQKTDELRTGNGKNPATDAGLNATVEEAKELASTCKKNSGPILEFMDTGSVAKDLDLLRALVGDEKLNYFGYSYGTKIGTVYSVLFPNRSGKLVLDGAVNVDLSPDELLEAQAAGFQKAIENYMNFCLTSPLKTCPFTGTFQNGLKQLKDYIVSLRTNPLVSSDDRLVTDSIFVSGLLTPLYDNQYWPHLTNALEYSMKKNDPSTILLFADFQAGRENNGTYKNNSYYAFNAVSCLDNHVTADPQKMTAEAEKLRNISPIFGEYLAYGNITCTNWAYPPRSQQGEGNISIDNPPLIIGTTNDPATPYKWAEDLHHKFTDSTLITFAGEGHTAFGRNPCISDAVNQYFLNNITPDPALRCAQEINR